MPEAKTARPLRRRRPREVGLLDQIVEQGRFGKDAPAKERGKDLVRQFVSEVLEGSITVGRDTEAMINARIAQIDHLISLQLNEVMQRPSSRSSRHVAGPQVPAVQTETSTMLKIKVLNVSKKDLLRDLQRAPEFDQSALFKKVYEEEYGVFGGAPFGALLGDYEFGRGRPGHRAAGEGLAGRGGGARAVHHGCVARDVQPRELHPARLSRATSRKIFDNTEYAKWKAFRQTRGFAVRGPHAAAHAAARALRQRHRPGRGVRLRGARRRHRTRPVLVGQRGLGARRAA